MALVGAAAQPDGAGAFLQGTPAKPHSEHRVINDLPSSQLIIAMIHLGEKALQQPGRPPMIGQPNPEWRWNAVQLQH